jgi:mono/diheme cytochrome c family protein
MMQAGAPSLALSSAVNARTPDGVIQAMLHGLPWRDGRAAAYMPAFGPALTDAQIAGLAAYLRATYTHEPAWPGLPDAVAKARKEQAS